MDVTITFTVNGKQRTVTVDPQRPLLDVLREELQLTGTKYGCGEGRCGACTVLLDGKRTRSCITPAASVEGKDVAHHRGPRACPAAVGDRRRRAPSRPGGVPGRGRVPVRLLHARHDHDHRGPASRDSPPDRRADSGRHEREPLPLLRLSQDPQGGAPRRRGRKVKLMTTGNFRAFDKLQSAPSETEERDPEPEETYAPAERGMTRRTFLKVVGAGLLITVMPLEVLGQTFRRGREAAEAGA